MTIIVKVHVRNCSMQSATNWGVHLKQMGKRSLWKSEVGESFLAGFCCQGKIPEVLLPQQTAVLNIRLKAEAESDNWSRRKCFDYLFDQFCEGFTAIPVSQNALGMEIEYPFAFGESANRWCNDSIDALEIRDFDNLELSQNFGRVKKSG